MGLEGSPERQGLLMTFLLLPYALSNIFLGPTADRWGPRKVLTLMTGLWSVAAIWMGAIGSYSLMLIGRVMRGTAEGPLFPVANRYIRYWFPPSERGGANAIWTSGQRVGMTVGRASADAGHRDVGLALRLIPAGGVHPYPGRAQLSGF